MSGRTQGYLFRSLRHLLALPLLVMVVTLTCATGFATEPATRNNGSNGSNDGSATLEIGIFPYLNTRTLLTTYQPLQQYLQNRLQRPVLFITAPDFRAFVERTQRGEYRFVLTAPHFARLAQQEAGYLPMLRTKKNIQGVVVVNQDSPLQDVSELRGKTIATPDSIAIISMLGIQLLRANGLQPGKDVVLQPAPSHDAAVLSLQRENGAAAAMVSGVALQQMPQELKMSVRTLATSSAVPPIMFLAHPKTSRREVADMTALLLEFAENTPEGKKFMSDTGHLGLRPPAAGEMKSLDPYVSDLKILLRKR